MGALKRYAFLVKHQSYSSDNQHAFLGSDEFSTTIVGVSGVEEAAVVTKELMKQGIQLVELCGGFTETEKNYIKQKVKGSIPVGIVKLDNDDLKLLEARSEN